MKRALADKNKFVTFALDSVKLSTAHRKEKGEERGRKVQEKTQRDLGPADTTIHTREEGPTLQLCGDSDVTCKRINGQYSLEQHPAHGGNGRLSIGFRRLMTS